MTWVNNETSTLAGSESPVGGAQGAAITAASSITVTDFVHTVSGSGTITTINGGVANGLYCLIPAAGSTWTLATGGNVAYAVAPTNGVPVDLVLDGATWRPSIASQRRFDVSLYGVSSSATAANNVTYIQAAVADLVAAGGGELYFPSHLGTFNVTIDGTTGFNGAVFELPSNSTVWFEGNVVMNVTGTYDDATQTFVGIFGPDPSLVPVSRLYFRDLTMTNNVTMGVNGTRGTRAINLTPRGALAAGVLVSDVIVDGCSFSGFGSDVYMTNASANLSDATRTVKNVRIVNNFSTGAWASFATVDGDHIYVAGNDFVGGANTVDAISCHCGRKVRIVGNTFRDIDSASGFGVNIRNSTPSDGSVTGSRDIAIVGNVFTDCDGQYCIAASAISDSTNLPVGAYAGQGISDITIADNVIRDCRRGINIQYNTNPDAGARFYGFSISGNVVQCYERGIVVAGNTENIVTGVTVSGNVINLMPTASSYLTGTLDFTQSNAAVTGTGTAFTTELAVGDWIDCANFIGKVDSITNDTSLTLTATWVGPTMTAAYARLVGDPVTTTDSSGLQLSYVQRATVTGNSVRGFIGAGTRVYTMLLDAVKQSSIVGNRVWTDDESIAGATTLSGVTTSSFSNNNIYGLVACAAGAFATGYASGNIFRTAASTFNGHAITASLVWGYDTSYFWKQGTAAPVGEDWVIGDRVENTAPAAGGYMGWVCTAAGTPGTWKGYGTIQV